MDQQEYNYDDYNNEYQNGYSNQQCEESSEHNLNVPGAYDNATYSNEQAIQQEEEYEILPLVKIFHQLNIILDEINGLVYLNRGWCLILLKDFKWDKDYLRQEYYNKNQFYLKRSGFRQGLDDPLNYNRGVKDICGICCNQDMDIYHNICGHEYCIQCWYGHLSNNIHTGFPKCMDDGCNCPVLLETIMGILENYPHEGKILMKKYEKKICELFITTNKNYQFCTGIDCGNCIKVNYTQIDAVTCTCGKVFCFSCQSDDHYPCKCQEKAKWIQQVVKEQADAKWISQNAKICPWCRKAVERSMGCNYMACTCGKSFCYMCSQPWQPDHKDHFKCHIFKKKPDDVLNRQKQVMQRMNHCTQRYIFNQAVANNYKQIDVFSKRKFLFKALRIDLTDSQFMQNAFKFAYQCCQKLKWIYAFTYFHDLKHRKQGFNFSLGEYQRYKENLLKLLAADLKIFMKKVQAQNLKQIDIYNLTEEFKSLKKQIVNYYTCTKKFKEKFVDQLTHITQEMNSQLQKEQMKKYIQQNPNLLLTKSKSNDKQQEIEKEQKKGFIATILGKKSKKKK